MSKTYIRVHLRELVYQRAKGDCEYCLVPEKASFALHQIDHIIAEKHGGKTCADNLALACIICNKHKGSDIASIDPDTLKITSLYHPRKEIWSEHFKLEQSGHILALTATGRVTLKLLQLNLPERISERYLLCLLTR